jgi:hypothetical protein
MIKETLSLLGKIGLADPADMIMLLDGDALEINIIRDGERMTFLNLAHFDVDDEGARIPVAPLGIKITIEKGSGGGQVEKRPTKLKGRPRKKASTRTRSAG